MRTNALYVFAAAALSVSALQGCAALAIGSAVGAGVIASQERSALSAYDDLTVQANLNAALIKHADARTFANVQTTVVEGRVLLTGVVPTQADRAHVADLAERTPGVLAVFDHLETADATVLSTLPDDAWYSTRFNAALLRDPDIKNQNFETVTQSGVIYVIGIAQDDEERSRVIDHAEALNPRDVVAHITLKDDPARFGEGQSAAYADQ